MKIRTKLKRAAINTAQFVALFALSLIAADALAQSIITLEEVNAAATEDDFALRMLGGLFGEQFVQNPFGISNAGAATSLIGALMFSFNAVIFVIGTAYLGWNIFTIIANGAHRGNAEGGEGKSALWMPIRNGVGTFMMLPALGGFSIAQGLMMLVITLGIGLANILTDTLLTRTSQMQAIVPSFSSATSAPNLSSELHLATRGLFLSEMCHTARLYKHETLPDLGTPPPAIRDVATRKEIGFDYGDCGRVTVRKSQYDDTRLNEGLQAKLGFRNAAVDYAAIAEEAHTAAWTQLQRIQREVRIEARDWLAMNGKVDTTWNQTQTLAGATPRTTAETLARLDQIEINARADLNGAIAGSTEGRTSGIQDEVLDTMQHNGWSFIGTYYSVFAEVGAALADAQRAWEISYTPGIVADHSVHKLRAGRGSLDAAAVDKFLIQSKIAERDKPRGLISTAVGVVTDTNATGERSIGQNLLNILNDVVAKDSGGHGLVNPVIASKNLGDYMMLAGQAGLLGTTLGKKTPAGRAMAEIVDQISGLGEMFKTLSWMLIGMGTFLSIYIPLTLYIVWFGALGTYLISTVEAVTYAQVAAMQHMHADGDNFVNGAATKLYTYAINMLLRPALLVLGFVFSSAIMISLGNFLIQTYSTAIAFAQGNSLTGVVSIIALLLIFCTMLFTIVQGTAQAVIIDMPNRLLSWLGGAIENHFNPSSGTGAVAATLRNAKGPVGSGSDAAKNVANTSGPNQAPHRA